MRFTPADMRTIGHVPPPLHPVAEDAVGTPHAPPRAFFASPPPPDAVPSPPHALVAEALRARPTEDPTFRPTFGPGVALVLAPVRRRYGDPLGRKGDTPFGNDEDKDIERIDRDGLVVGFREHQTFGWIYEVSYEDGDSDELTWPELLLILTSPHHHASPETRAVADTILALPPDERGAAVRALRASGKDYLKRNLVGYQTFKLRQTRGKANAYLARVQDPAGTCMNFHCHFPTRWGAAAAYDLLARALARYGPGAADETINFPTDISYDTLLGVVLGGADDSNWTAADTRTRRHETPPPRTNARRKTRLADRYDPGDYRVTSPLAKRRKPADADPRDPGSNPGENDATTDPKNVAPGSSARPGEGFVESGGRGRGAETASGSARGNAQRQQPQRRRRQPSTSPRRAPLPRPPRPRPHPQPLPPQPPPPSSPRKPPARGAASPAPTQKRADPKSAEQTPRAGFEPARSTFAEGAVSSPRRAGPNARTQPVGASSSPPGSAERVCDARDALTQAKRMLDGGLVSREEYDDIKRMVLLELQR